MITPVPTLWWLRPVSSAARVGLHSRGVKAGIGQAFFRELVEVRRWYRPAECGRHAEPDIIEQDQ
jgi:hypothetical protein